MRSATWSTGSPTCGLCWARTSTKRSPCGRSPDCGCRRSGSTGCIRRCGRGDVVDGSASPIPTTRGERSMANPFDSSGITLGADGIKRYDGLVQNLITLLRSAVDSAGDTEALVQLGGERVTYQQLWERATRVAGGLRAAGVHPGDRVANRLPNGNDWVYAFWGTLLAGAVVVPVNTRFTDAEAAYVIEDSGSAYVFEPGVTLPEGDAVAVADQPRDGLAAIFYTSGTTGFPKGAMTTHENFL